MNKGTRVQLTKPYNKLLPGALGTVTWYHPSGPNGNSLHYRVKWDDDKSYINWGMDDIGWLMEDDEILEVVE